MLTAHLSILGPSGLKYGVSITDACVDWESTIQMLDRLNEVSNPPSPSPHEEFLIAVRACSSGYQTSPFRRHRGWPQEAPRLLQPGLNRCAPSYLLALVMRALLYLPPALF
jgi:hypothetical protein